MRRWREQRGDGGSREEKEPGRQRKDMEEETAAALYLHVWLSASSLCAISVMRVVPKPTCHLHSETQPALKPKP